MGFSLESWREDVRRAAVTGDEAALIRLFAEGRQALGDNASTEWASTLSALDGTAVTG